MEIERAMEIITNAVQTGNYTAVQDKALALVQKAVERQIPKKVKLDIRSFSNELVRFSLCPCCNKEVGYAAYKHKYCYYCGQALDWSGKK